MKQTIVILLILSMLALTACHHESTVEDQEAVEIEKELQEIDDLDIDAELAELDSLEQDLGLI